MNDSLEERFTYYYDRLRGPEQDDAYHSLLEMNSGIASYLQQKFEAEADPDVAALVLKILSQTAPAESRALFFRAVHSSERAIRREALNGLLELDHKLARKLLEQARRELPQFREEIDDALESLGDDR